MPKEPIVLETREILPGLKVQLEKDKWDGEPVEIWHVYDNGRRYGTVVENGTTNAAAYAVLIALQARFDGLNSQFACFASRMLQLGDGQ